MRDSVIRNLLVNPIKCGNMIDLAFMWEKIGNAGDSKNTGCAIACFFSVLFADFTHLSQCLSRATVMRFYKDKTNVLVRCDLHGKRHVHRAKSGTICISRQLQNKWRSIFADGPMSGRAPGLSDNRQCV